MEEQTYSIQYGSLSLTESTVEISIPKRTQIVNILLAIFWFFWGLAKMYKSNFQEVDVDLVIGALLIISSIFWGRQAMNYLRNNSISYQDIVSVKVKYISFQRKYRVTFKIAPSKRKVLLGNFNEYEANELIKILNSKHVNVEF